MRYQPIILACLILTTAGCRSAPVKTPSAPVAHHTPTGRVARLLVLWTDSVLRQDNVPVAQGFIGRVYLLGPDSQDPVQAPGEFRFYAFQGGTSTGQASRKIEPNRQWTFSAQDAAATMRKDALGWGYSFWLPWGPPETSDLERSLMVRFTPQQGAPVVSESSLVTLPSLQGPKVRPAAQRVELPADAAAEKPGG